MFLNYGIRDIAGYEGIYKITNTGMIWSVKKRKFLNPFNNGNGYMKVTLYKNG